jgi:hypothetical protein
VQTCVLHTDSKVVSGQIEKKMHSKGANIREIPSSSLKDGELLQGIHSGIH